MGRKYFFFDIDGTLTDNSTRKIVPSAALAVEKLRESGHFVAIATGRAYYKSDPFRAAHGFSNMVCNGGHGIVIDGVLRENSPIDYEKALAIYYEATDLGYGVLVALNDSKEVYTRDFRFYDQCGIRKEATTYIIDDAFDPADHDAIYKMYVSVPKEEEHRLTLRNTIPSLRFEPEYLMFQPDEKKAGILRMLELVGGDPEDVVVFGDDVNDLCMFEKPFYRVAMGNACDILKEHADHVADLNVNDGIYKACLAHGWIRHEQGKR